MSFSNALMKSSRSVASRSHSRTRRGFFSWLSRSKLSARNSITSVQDLQTRNMFGVGEIVNVIANPGQTVKSLADSRRLLEETRQELRENRERAQIRPTHTFSPLPGFFPRYAEIRAIERALEGAPSFTVLFGASSVGKTAILREVLSRDTYHVLHFDLRIAGFADLGSLYMSLSQQMEQFFDSLSKAMEGYEDFEKEAWGFKHDRLNLQRDLENNSQTKVKTSDIARLMELFQSSLLRYWQFEVKKPETDSESTKNNSDEKGRSGNGVSEKHSSPNGQDRKEMSQRIPEFERKNNTSRMNGSAYHMSYPDIAEKEKAKLYAKKMPVIFFDEAHKLPALIRSTEAMKCILDAMLVLTKQDRLCHVIHATSDSFYQTWLRQLNVMQHCKIISIGDCSKHEVRLYFRERLLPGVPDQLRDGLSFESLYNAFGGKLAHWADYITDYVNSNGQLTINMSSHFLQAHALLNLQIIHAAEAEIPLSRARRRRSKNRISKASGFGIYSSIPSGSPIQRPGTENANAEVEDPISFPRGGPAFTAIQMLKVIRKLSEPDVVSLPYFLLCRELGVHAVDDMVRGRILELRWTDTVTREGDTESWTNSPRTTQYLRGSVLRTESQGSGSGMEIIGPKLVPTTPIMRYAMREVLKEYNLEDDIVDQPSEYTSLSEVDEY